MSNAKSAYIFRNELDLTKETETDNQSKLTVQGDAKLGKFIQESGDGYLLASEGANVTSSDFTNSGMVQILNSSAEFGKYVGNGDSTLFIDPAYVKISDSSKAFSGSVLVGNGGVLEAGSVDELKAQMVKAGFSANAINAGVVAGQGQSVFAVGEPVSIGASGKLIVSPNVNEKGEGAGTVNAGSAKFDNGSLFVINEVNTSTPALTVNSDITVEDGAKLAVGNKLIASTGKYLVAKSENGKISLNGQAWNGSNLFVTVSKLLKAEVKLDGNSLAYIGVDVDPTAGHGNSKLDSDLTRTISALATAGLFDENSANGGERFLNRAVNRLDWNTAQSTIEGASKVMFAAAIPQNMLNLSAQAMATAHTRTSFFGSVGLEGKHGYSRQGEQGLERRRRVRQWLCPLDQPNVSEHPGLQLSVQQLRFGIQYQHGWHRARCRLHFE